MAGQFYNNDKPLLCQCMFRGHESHNKLERTCENCDGDHDEQDATIPVKGVPLLILEDTCSQEISKSEQADLSQTSDSSICNSIKLEALDGLLKNGNRENCTTYTTCTREARITISNVRRQLHTREFSTKAAVKSMSSYNIVNSLLNDVKMKISETAKRLYADKIISNQPEKSISLESTNNSLALNSDKVLQMGWASKSINPE
ncbi:unnamed protein product [Mytilus edulis]|uniref:Uncharacterized protein n=1 Tax=Mytilus edulis TaxID=6550 RepID=A0A8S3QWE3_MYTED|nr:unnamed protein product [Mytilus edulis]